MTFEQIRHFLRQGNQEVAYSEIMRVWEGRVLDTVTLPSDRVDWNAKVADECIVDTWALAKISRIPAVA